MEFCFQDFVETVLDFIRVQMFLNKSSIDADAAVDIIGAYATPERTASLKRQHTTPENISVKRVMGMSQSPAPAGTFSPASFSPAA